MIDNDMRAADVCIKYVEDQNERGLEQGWPTSNSQKEKGVCKIYCISKNY